MYHLYKASDSTSSYKRTATDTRQAREAGTKFKSSPDLRVQEKR